MSSIASSGSSQPYSTTSGPIDPLTQPQAIAAPESIHPDDPRWAAYRLRSTASDSLNVPLEARGSASGLVPYTAGMPKLVSPELKQRNPGWSLLLCSLQLLTLYSLADAHG